MNDCKQFIKAGFIVFDYDFRNYFLISCRNDAAIMFVLGNINSNKYIDIGLYLLINILSTAVFHREFGCVIT